MSRTIESQETDAFADELVSQECEKQCKNGQKIAFLEASGNTNCQFWKRQRGNLIRDLKRAKLTV